MARQSGPETCEIYISPDDRQLLARIARHRGVGRDYLTLREVTKKSPPTGGRPIPRWLGREKVITPPSRPGPHAGAQTQHCRTCVNLSPLSTTSDPVRFICAHAVWTYPLLEQSVQTSRHLRLLSLTCGHYARRAPRQRSTPHHCRACQHLVAADTVDERYVCGKSVWTNPMKPQSVANARRLVRLGAACSLFAPRAGRWLPRSVRRMVGERAG